jgi:hypothetical protein
MLFNPDRFDGENNTTDAYEGGYDDGYADGKADALRELRDSA